MKKIFVAIISVFLFSAPSVAAGIEFLKNEEYFHALENKIRSAKEEIVVSVYVFRTTESKRNLAAKVRDELIAAASRGIKVTVYLEKEKRERKGSSLNDGNAYTARILAKGGVRVSFDDPDKVSHSKVVIVDGRYVFIGSHNLTDSALRWNNEASVLIDSKEIARDAASFVRGIEVGD